MAKKVNLQVKCDKSQKEVVFLTFFKQKHVL